MEPEDSVPQGEPEDGVPAEGDAPRVRDALILPVVFITATWAVERFTRSALGDWRYVAVAILGACAVYFTALAVIVALVLTYGKPVDPEDPRR